MLKYIFTIALALPVCVFAEKNESESWVLQSQCLNETNEKVNSAYNQYTKMLVNLVAHRDSESFANFKTSFKNFTIVISETCAGGKMPSNVDTFSFIEFIEFALKDDKFFNFTTSNGSLCVDAASSDIYQCITEHVGTASQSKADNDTDIATGSRDVHVHDNNTNISDKRYKQNILRLLKKTNLVFNDYNCEKTTELRKCVISAMIKKHNATCTTEHSEFVDSLFNFPFAVNKCLLPSEIPYTPSGAYSFLLNPVVILLPLVGTMFIK